MYINLSMDMYIHLVSRKKIFVYHNWNHWCVSTASLHPRQVSFPGCLPHSEISHVVGQKKEEGRGYDRWRPGHEAYRQPVSTPPAEKKLKFLPRLAKRLHRFTAGSWPVKHLFNAEDLCLKNNEPCPKPFWARFGLGVETNGVQSTKDPPPVEMKMRSKSL